MRLVCHPVINNVAWSWLPCCPHALLGLLAYSYGSGCSWDWRRNQKQCIIITFCDDLCQNNFIAITLIFSQVHDRIFIKQRQISSSGAGKKKLPGKPKWISGENASAKMPAIQLKRPSSKKRCIKWCFKPNLGIQSLPTMFSFHTVTPGLWCRKKAKLIVRALNDSLNAFRHWMLFQSGSFMGGKYNFQVSKSMAWPKQTQYVTGKTLDIKVGKRLTMDMKHRTPKVQSVMFWL